jgi:hypothetical protein
MYVLPQVLTLRERWADAQKSLTKGKQESLKPDLAIKADLIEDLD